MPVCMLPFPKRHRTRCYRCGADFHDSTNKTSSLWLVIEKTFYVDQADTKLTANFEDDICR